jgi:putative transposase
MPSGTLQVLCHADFVDKAPAHMWASLPDEGQCLCSQSAMYGILRQHGEVRERRALATHAVQVESQDGWSEAESLT